MHQRQVIRDAVATALTGATAAGDSVFPSRVLPYVLPDLPVLSVYTPRDNVDQESATTAPRELTRELTIIVEAMSSPGPSVDDTLDDLAAEIEAAMHADPYFGDVCADSILTTTEIELIEDGEKSLGWMALTYSVTYQTQAPEAPTDLDDFEEAYATHNVGNGVDDDQAAKDSITVRE